MHMTGWLMFACCTLLEMFHYGSWWGLPAAVLLIVSLLLHEAGHMFVAAALGVEVREFGICLLGAYNRRARGNSRRDEVLISIAGPLMNFALLIPCFFLPRIGVELVLCNLMLGVGNLLPIPSSDGMRILQTIWGPYPVVRAVPIRTYAEPAIRDAA
jgi:Zn-dependent protease